MIFNCTQSSDKKVIGTHWLVHIRDVWVEKKQHDRSLLNNDYNLQMPTASVMYVLYAKRGFMLEVKLHTTHIAMDRGSHINALNAIIR